MKKLSKIRDKNKQ